MRIIWSKGSRSKRKKRDKETTGWGKNLEDEQLLLKMSLGWRRVNCLEKRMLTRRRLHLRFTAWNCFTAQPLKPVTIIHPPREWGRNPSHGATTVNCWHTWAPLSSAGEEALQHFAGGGETVFASEKFACCNCPLWLSIFSIMPVVFFASQKLSS